MAVASRGARDMRRLAVAELRVWYEQDNTAITWSTAIIDAPPLLRPDSEALARARRTEVMIPVLESKEEVNEVRMVAECGIRMP